MRKGKRVAAAAAAAILALALGASAFLELAREPELLVADGRGRAIASFVPAEGLFSHVYVHSVHKSPVEERFRIEFSDPKGGPSLRLYELRYENEGVGMPVEAELGFRLEAGTYVLSMDRSFSKISIRVSPIAGHGISLEGRFLPFSDWAPPGGELVLSARTRTSIRLRTSIRPRR